MKERFILEPYKGLKTRHPCPKCSAKRVFVRFVDTENNCYLPDHVGRCGNENSCGYFYGSSMFIRDNPDYFKSNDYQKAKIEKVAPMPEKPDYLNRQLMTKSINLCRNSSLYKWFLSLGFEDSVLFQAFLAYRTGTDKHGNTIFWYEDICKHVRTGQIVPYKEDGHRDKSKHPSSVPTKLNLKGYYTQCMFGEHLLNFLKDGEPIGLVESPKTALICHLFKYKGVSKWLSYTSQKNLNERRIEPIKNYLINRPVFIAPDYHYTDRMINGMIQARKIETSKGVKLSRHGAPVPKGDYSYKRDLLIKYGIDYRFLESPLGQFDDTKNDIGDYLSLLNPLPLITFESCKNCCERVMTTMIEGDKCQLCVKPQLSTSKEDILHDYMKDKPHLKSLVDGLELSLEDPPEEWAVLMPYLPNKDYSKSQEVKFSDAAKWIDQHFGITLSLESFKSMVLTFLSINSTKISGVHDEINNLFTIKYVQNELKRF